MKRWLAVAFISSYLGVLSYGVGCHTFGAGQTSHTLMYFIVWDMFCGWASYASNLHIIAEGESQKYYELAPAPWGEFVPWGYLGRRHYDAFNTHTPRIAMNTLKHTKHEPITRVFVVEETWAKKFDLPDHIWNQRYEVPKDLTRYCRLRTELTADGQVARSYIPWSSYQRMQNVGDNPRLLADWRKGRPLFMLDNSDRADMSNDVDLGKDQSQGTSYAPGSTLGN